MPILQLRSSAFEVTLYQNSHFILYGVLFILEHANDEYMKQLLTGKEQKTEFILNYYE